MLIAFTIFKYFPYGGIQRDMLRIATQLVEDGHQVRIYTLGWEGPRPLRCEIVIAPVRALTNHGRYRRFAAWTAAALRAHPVDVVVGMNKMPGLDVYFAGDPCFEHAARTRRALYRMTPRYRLFARFERTVFQRGARTTILTISPVQIPLFQRYYGTEAERLRALPPGIDRSRMARPDSDAIRCAFRRERGLGHDDRLVLMLGSGFRTKGLDRVLRGLASLSDPLRARTRLYVVGQDNPAPFRRLARRLGVAAQTTFFAGRDDVPRFLFGADLLVLPAYSENTGTAIIEAIVAGLPTLVSANCGYASHVLAADAGRVVPEPFRQQAFDENLATMLSDDEGRARWRANGIDYGRRADLYDLHRHAAAIIADAARPAGEGQRAPEPSRAPALLWVRADLASQLPGDPWAALMATPGEAFRVHHARCTVRLQWGERAFFVKRHFGVGWHEIAKNVAAGKVPVVDASNEVRACARLTAAGLRTPVVAAYGWRGRNPARRQSFVASEELVGQISLEDYCATWPTEAPSAALRRRLIVAVAELARQMHDAGVAHRDFYLCHIWLDRAALAAGRTVLTVIDLHRARVGDRTPNRWVHRDLAALWFSAMQLCLSRRDLLRFVAAYERVPPAAAVRSRPAFWRAVDARAVRLYRKGVRKGLVPHHLAAA
jgi:UDP-glucose:(heptosyl)LPS alpha-1,3-glucosyltransferase